jgi:hypothetical protein
MLEELDTNAYYAFGIPFYVALVVLEQWLARRRGLTVYRFADTLGNFCAGLGEVTIGLFLGPVLLWLYDFGYQHLRLVTWPASPVVRRYALLLHSKVLRWPGLFIFTTPQTHIVHHATNPFHRA